MPSVEALVRALEQTPLEPVRAREACVEIGHLLGRGALGPAELDALRAAAADARRDPGGRLDGYLACLHDLLAACERAALGRVARERLVRWVEAEPGRAVLLASLFDRPQTIAELANGAGHTRLQVTRWVDELEREGLLEPCEDGRRPRRLASLGAEVVRVRAERATAEPRDAAHARYEVPEPVTPQAAGWRSSATRATRKRG